MRSRLLSLRAGFGLSWRADPRLTIGLSADVLALSLTGPVSAVALGALIDDVLAGDESGAMRWGLLLGVNVGLTWFLATAATALTATLTDRTSLLLNRWLMQTSATLPGLEHHERSDYLDRMQLLQNDTQTLVNAMPSAVRAVGLTVELIVTLGLLMALHPVLAFLPLFAVPALVAGSLSQRLTNQTATANAEPQRLLAHLFSLILDARLSKELRIFGAGTDVLTRWRRTWQTIEDRRLATLIRTSLLSTLGSLVFIAGQVGAVLLVATRAQAGEATVGDLGLVIALAARVSGQVSRAVGEATAQQAMGQAMDRYLWLRQYHADAQAGRGTAPPPERLNQGIELRDVCFRYPGTGLDVLHDVNLLIPAGSTVAIVGENGAGKTTLGKLLCGFYEPSAGAVLIDGADLRTLDLDAWRRRISAAFQDVLRLELRARESVELGEQRRQGEDQAAETAVARAGATDVVAAMPQGLETQLGRDWTDGVDLSGGQWQKLGLARAMMRLRPLLLILDEPTSALDPHSEHALFERYATAARHAGLDVGAITLLVSHRFSTVQMADLILVVDAGRVVEHGTHRELLAAAGLYAELFAIQASAYS